METNDSAERKAVWLTGRVLIVLVVGMVFIGHGRKAWPIVAWSMYSTRVMPPPSDTVTTVYLVVGLKDGGERRLEMGAFFPVGRHEVARKIVLAAFDEDGRHHRDNARRALVSMVGRVMPGDRIASIEARQTVWSADPLATPPVEVDRPAEDRSLGRVVLPDRWEAGG